MYTSAPAREAHPRRWVESPRFRLAQLAREAALEVPGVLASDPGPKDEWVTVDHGERLRGVMCIATAAGGYDIWLRLNCAFVPLIELSERVALAVRSAAMHGGYRVDDLRIEIGDVADPLEA